MYNLALKMLDCTYNECVVYNIFYTIMFIIRKNGLNLLHKCILHVHLSLGNIDGDVLNIIVIVEYSIFVV
jgi:hypothetical protein